MGEELATKMMDSLPPAGWGDVATKQDLEDLRIFTEREFVHHRQCVALQIEGQVDKLAGRLYRALAAQTIAFATMVVSIAIAADIF